MTALCSVHIRSVHIWLIFWTECMKSLTFNRKCVQLVKCEPEDTKLNVTATFGVSVWTVTRTVAKRLSKTRAATCDVTREEAFTVPQHRRIFFGRRQQLITHCKKTTSQELPAIAQEALVRLRRENIHTWTDPWRTDVKNAARGAGSMLIVEDNIR